MPAIDRSFSDFRWPEAIGLPGGLSPGCVPGEICMGTKGTKGYATWRWLLDEFYNNPKFESIIYRPHDAGGKKLLMLPNSLAPAYGNVSFVSLLESNGGRNDISVISVAISIKTDEFCSKNDGSCIQIDEFVFKMMILMQTSNVQMWAITAQYWTGVWCRRFQEKRRMAAFPSEKS